MSHKSFTYLAPDYPGTVPNGDREWKIPANRHRGESARAGTSSSGNPFWTVAFTGVDGRPGAYRTALDHGISYGVDNPGIASRFSDGYPVVPVWITVRAIRGELRITDIKPRTVEVTPDVTA